MYASLRSCPENSYNLFWRHLPSLAETHSQDGLINYAVLTHSGYYHLMCIEDTWIIDNALI